MTAVTETSERLAPVAVDCSWCRSQFLSRARHHTVVRCPRCKHAVRVKRPDRLGARPARPRAAVLPTVSVTVPDPPISADDEEDDDGETYVYDKSGRLVLAEWTADGRLVPAGRPATPVIDYRAELAARNWKLRHHGALTCYVIAMTPHGWHWVPPEECPARAEHEIPGGAICSRHYQALHFLAASA